MPVRESWVPKMKCGFCGADMEKTVPRHGGRECRPCGMLYAPWKGKAILERTLTREGWRQFPYGVLVVRGDDCKPD